jgi:hypothetical protein
MNRKKIGVLIAVFNIIVAVWYFDWNNPTQIIISTVLFLSGISLLLTGTESKSLQKAGSYLLYFGGILAVILLFKKLFIG